MAVSLAQWFGLVTFWLLRRQGMFSKRDQDQNWRGCLDGSIRVHA
jgi:hypothetical protein